MESQWFVIPPGLTLITRILIALNHIIVYIIVSTGIISPVLFFLHLLGVAIGFEQISYTVTEGTDANVELCAIIFNESLERAATVVFSTSDGNATSSG